MRRCGEEDGDFLEKMRPVVRCRVRLSHPPENQLERFMRGELKRQERHAIVRHLLTGCPRFPGSYGGDLGLMAKGAAVALVSGLAGGALAGLLGGRRPLRHALAVLPWLLVDSTYVLFFFPRRDPLWFDLLGSLGLIAATIAGGRAARQPAGRRVQRGLDQVCIHRADLPVVSRI